MTSKLRIYIYTILWAIISFSVCDAKQTLYAISNSATPVFRQSNFDDYFKGKLKLDSYEQINPLEFISPPGAWFEVVSAQKRDGYRILGVNSDFYPIKGGRIYIDSRFIKFSFTKPTYQLTSYTLSQMQTRLKSMIGLPYVWGSNWPFGIRQMINFYPPAIKLDDYWTNKWILKGVDCSGLLRYANGGVTPRNTRDIARFGEAIPIQGLTTEQIAAKLKPMDVIVREGHMMVVYDEKTIIESNVDYEPSKKGFQGGVRTHDLMTRLGQIMKTRKPYDSLDDIPPGKLGFVVRRWFNNR